MENYNRIVIELYKKCFTDYVQGSPVDVDAILEAQKCINFAIDKSIIEGKPVDYLEILKKDVEYLKYELL